jgi:FKBP-type peptidyl-prolyl cis-trans isomerase 2
MAELSSGMQKFLTQANKRWKAEAERAKEEGGGFTEVDDGRYIARLTSGELADSAASGRPMMPLGFTILEGDNTGDKVTHFRMLDGDEGLKWAGKDLMVFGIDPEDVIWDPKKAKEDMYILNVLKELVKEKPVVKIRLKTKGDFQNVMIEGLIEDYEGGDDDAGKIDDAEVEVGSTVTWKKGKKTMTGKVTKLKGDTATIEGEDDETYKVEVEDLTLVEDESGSDEPEIEVGSKVSWKKGKKTLTGTVKKIKGDAVTVEDEDDETHKLELDDLTLIEDDDEGSDEPEIEVGSTVKWGKGKKEKTGEVSKIKGDMATVKDDDGEKHLVEISDLTLVEAEEDGAVTVGCKVGFTWKGDDLEGVVKEVLEDDEKLKVKVGSKVYTVKAADCELIDGDKDK